MPIVYAAITPHSPILLPTIGKEKTQHLESTLEALTHISNNLYTHRPDILIILSPHAGIFDTSFTMHGSISMRSDFSRFGDLSTSQSYLGVPHVATQLAHRLCDAGFETRVVSEENIDYGTAIPLYHTLTKSSPVRILPIGFSSLSPRVHYDFGRRLREIILDIDLRVAIIASGDLSHSIDTNSVRETLDERIENYIKTNSGEELLTIPSPAILTEDVCAYRPLLMMMGAFHGQNYKYRRLAYEHPFGVGYLTAELSLS
jgi:MEMO1 family protein